MSSERKSCLCHVMMFSTANQNMIALGALNTGFSIISSAYSFYYVNFFLNFYHIEEKWFQIAHTLAFIWNAASDPLFGYIQDTKNCRFIKTRRENILYTAPLFAMAFLLPWFSWELGNTTSGWLIGLHLIISLCLYNTMYTFICLASCCLFTEMSRDQSYRLRLTRCSELGSMIGSTSVLILEYTSHGLLDLRAFQVTSCVLALVAWLLMHYTGKHAHTEYEICQGKITTPVQPEVSSIDRGTTETFSKLVQQILTQKNFLYFVLTKFLHETHRTFLSNFTVIICDQLLSIEEVPLAIRSTFYGVLAASSQVIVILGIPFVARAGYYDVIRASFAWKVAAGVVMLMVDSHNPWLLMSFLWLDSSLANATYALFNMPLADLVDEDMDTHHRKHPISSMVFGINKLLVKPAVSLCPMLVVSVLNRFGYGELNDTNNVLQPDQLASLHEALFRLVCTLPMVIGVLQLCSWSMFTIRYRLSVSTEESVGTRQC
ncbi:hypothetical protein ScPMuIL_004517 [Solemya velum]